MTQPLLVIDTVGPWCAAALDVAGRLHEAGAEIGRGHAEVLAPMVEGLLTEAGLAAPELARIGVNTGPGSFAGTRVGVAFARGLALSTGAQAVGVGLLPALALRACPDADRTVLAIHDAKRGDYLWSVFAPGETQAPTERGPLSAAQTTAAAIAHPIVTGSGAEAIDGPPFDPAPPLAALVSLTRQAPADAPPPAPIYARPPDAKPARS